MSLLPLALVALLGALFWYWIDTIRAAEFATQAARRACEVDGVQLLDDTVACLRTRLARDDEGHLRLARRYQFEFSDTGNNRRRGSIAMLGHHVEVVSTGPRPVSASTLH